MSLMTVFAFFSFALGAVVASFLNVVIWRVPRGESIVSPPSHCPSCGALIRWWQNIPIISFLLLRGRCAGCKVKISPRYVIVEAIGAVLFLATFMHFKDYLPDADFRIETILEIIVWWIWISLMIVGSFIDFDHKLLPDFTTVGGMMLGVGYWALVALGHNDYALDFLDFRMYLPLIWSLGGLVFGFGLLWLIRFLGSKAFGREAMGMGDVFLMGAVGALFGPVAVLLTMILSSFFGALVGLSMIRLSKTRLGGFCEIPYGPYICLGNLVWMFWGNEIVRWYLEGLK